MAIILFLKKEETFSSEASVSTYKITQCQNPDDHDVKCEPQEHNLVLKNEVFGPQVDNHERLCVLLTFNTKSVDDNDKYFHRNCPC